uniref:Saccharopine dehydrogenase NADP binding domain-containing protein n=1 Tax=Quercus lobata TaxID=97700 RepID=A0A7N2KMS5_QUELO
MVMARALLHLKSTSGFALACASQESQYRVQLPDKSRSARVLVLGGTGRVGGSTATALSKLCPDLQIIIAGRNREKGASMVATLGGRSEFAEVNIDNVKSLEAALRVLRLKLCQFLSRCGSCSSYCWSFPTGREMHCSGSCHTYQGEKKTAYIDVCDDTTYACRAKSFKTRAVAANIPAITTAGIYPGVSNVMAAELVRASRSESKGEPERLRFYYYTAGSGGAGPTILATSFLLLGEEVVAYNKGETIKLKPYSGMLNIDFGKGIGKRDVYLLNLPEVRSAHEVLGVPTVSARFGTAPFFWNWAMEAMTSLLPAEFLRDRSKVQELVQLFDPVVRSVDKVAGERVSMRVRY